MLLINSYLHDRHMRDVTVKAKVAAKASRLKGFEESLVHQMQLLPSFLNLSIDDLLPKGRHPFETELELLVTKLGQDLLLENLTHKSFGCLELGLCDVGHQDSDVSFLFGSICTVNRQAWVQCSAGILNFLYSSTNARVVNLKYPSVIHASSGHHGPRGEREEGGRGILHCLCEGEEK